MLLIITLSGQCQLSGSGICKESAAEGVLVSTMFGGEGRADGYDGVIQPAQHGANFLFLINSAARISRAAFCLYSLNSTHIQANNKIPFA